MTESFDAIVVGGGVAGLTVAWRLQQQRPDLRVVVLEASDRPGGKIRSEVVEHDDGPFLIELGADSMLNASKPWARQLCSELGLDDDILTVESVASPTAIWRDGRPVDIPAGLSPLAPTQIEPFLQSPLLSQEGRQRALQEIEIPVRDGDDDESLGAFVTRRFGHEHLDGIAEPLLAGIYNADPDKLSLLATFPNFRKLEVEYGSVTRGVQRAQPSSGGSPFFTLRNGIEQLPGTLASRLGPIVRTRSQVERIDRADAGDYGVTLTTGEQLTTPSVVLAVPPSAAGALLSPVSPESLPLLNRLKASSSGAIVAAWPDRQIERPLPGYGLVVPKREGQPFNAITVKSRKYAGRAPQGWSLFRFFFGGYRSPQTLDLDDEELLQVTCTFAEAAIGSLGGPAFARIERWSEGSPIFRVGHLPTIAALDASLPAGLYLTGAHYRGAGIPDVVRSAGAVASRIAVSPIPTAV